jgi:hypothetical protein
MKREFITVIIEHEGKDINGNTHAHPTKAMLHEIFKNLPLGYVVRHENGKFKESIKIKGFEVH